MIVLMYLRTNVPLPKPAREISKISKSALEADESQNQRGYQPKKFPPYFSKVTYASSHRLNLGTREQKLTRFLDKIKISGFLAANCGILREGTSHADHFGRASLTRILDKKVS